MDVLGDYSSLFTAVVVAGFGFVRAILALIAKLRTK